MPCCLEPFRLASGRFLSWVSPPPPSHLRTRVPGAVSEESRSARLWKAAARRSPAGRGLPRVIPCRSAGWSSAAGAASAAGRAPGRAAPEREQQVAAASPPPPRWPAAGQAVASGCLNEAQQDTSSFQGAEEEALRCGCNAAAAAFRLAPSPIDVYIR